MTTSELLFPAPGAKFYVQGIGLSVIGLALIAWGVVILAFDPWNWPQAIFLLGGLFVTILGAVFCLFVWFTLALGTISAWRNWRRFRAPTVVIDAAGVRYLASRRSATIPWSEIEQLGVRRTIFRNRVVTKVFLRLTPWPASFGTTDAGNRPKSSRHGAFGQRVQGFDFTVGIRGNQLQTRLVFFGMAEKFKREVTAELRKHYDAGARLDRDEYLAAMHRVALELRFPDGQNLTDRFAAVMPHLTPAADKGESWP